MICLECGDTYPPYSSKRSGLCPSCIEDDDMMDDEVFEAEFQDDHGEIGYEDDDS